MEKDQIFKNLETLAEEINLIISDLAYHSTLENRIKPLLADYNDYLNIIQDLEKRKSVLVEKQYQLENETSELKGIKNLKQKLANLINLQKLKKEIEAKNNDVYYFTDKWREKADKIHPLLAEKSKINHDEQLKNYTAKVISYNKLLKELNTRYGYCFEMQPTEFSIDTKAINTRQFNELLTELEF